MEILYKTYKILINYCVNYDNFSNMSLVKMSLSYIKEDLLPRIVFIDNTFLKNIYIKVRLNPTLLSDTFNLKNFSIVDDNNKNDFENVNEFENEDNKAKINDNSELAKKSNNDSGNNKERKSITNEK